MHGQPVGPARGRPGGRAQVRTAYMGIVAPQAATVRGGCSFPLTPRPVNQRPQHRSCFLCPWWAGEPLCPLTQSKINSSSATLRRAR